MNKEIEIPEGYEAKIEGNKIILEPKESKDEKIRQSIVELVKWVKAQQIHNDHYNGIKWDEMIAYLKKQKESEIKVIIPKFRVGDIVKSISQPSLPPVEIKSIGQDCYYTEHGCIGFAWEKDYEFVEQKPVEWSAEDEEMLDAMIDMVSNSLYEPLCPREEMLAWLEKQKGKGKSEGQKIVEYSAKCDPGVTVSSDERANEDEKIRRTLLGYFKDQDAQYTFRGLTNAEVITWLERQKEQKPAEWSEEDKRAIDRACIALRAYSNGELPEFLPSELLGYADRLQSLLLQPHWKPSEEQMDALETAVSSLQSTALESLYNDLKKLM